MDYKPFNLTYFMQMSITFSHCVDNQHLIFEECLTVVTAHKSLRYALKHEIFLAYLFIKNCALTNKRRFVVIKQHSQWK